MPDILFKINGLRSCYQNKWITTPLNFCSLKKFMMLFRKYIGHKSDRINYMYILSLKLYD